MVSQVIGVCSYTPLRTEEKTMNTEQTTFEQLGLGATILAGIAHAGYDVPTAIQAEAIPLIQGGRDIIGLASTGTGKTAAFGLPMLDKIDVSRREVQGLVLAPTRELAQQVAAALESYAVKKKGIKVLAIYGGQSIGSQLRDLSRGVHIVVGTPGRVLDHLRRGSLKLGNVSALVVDEADEMLRMGFIDDVETIVAETPKDRHTSLFSATMPRGIERIANRHLSSPTRVSISRSEEAADIEERYIRVRGHEKLAVLQRVLRFVDTEGVLIFAERRADTEQIASALQGWGLKAEAINGDLSQQQRESVLARLKDKSLDILVGTDVAARGLDVDHLNLVINFDLPSDFNTYTHRVGRTGRAGREGMAISFVTSKQFHSLKRLEKTTGSTLRPMSVPSDEQLLAQQKEQSLGRIRELLVAPDTIPSSHYDLVKSLGAEGFHMTQIAAALSSLLGQTENVELAPMPVRSSSGRDSTRGRNSSRRDRKSRGSRGHRKGRSENSRNKRR